MKFFGASSNGDTVTAYATVRVNLVISDAAASGDLQVKKRGIVKFSSKALGTASVIADLSAIGGPAALELYGSAETGAYSFAAEVTPPSPALRRSASGPRRTPCPRQLPRRSW